jgi:hypothetical protein
MWEKTNMYYGFWGEGDMCLIGKCPQKGRDNVKMLLERTI